MSSVTASQAAAYPKLESLDKVVQVCAIIATVSSIAIIVLTGLAVGGYVRPLLPVYILPVPLCCFFIARVLESCQRAIMQKTKPPLDYEVWNNHQHPLPEDSKKEKKHKSK